MKTILKPIVKVGNSAGVILPIEWYGGKAKIELVKKPLNIKEDILKILDSYLNSILGVYLTGSYARREQEEDSDIDILAITSDINKRIRKGKYDVLLISLEEVKKAIQIIIPLIPMLKEASPIINSSLLEELKKNDIKKDYLKWHFETTYSSLKIIRNILNLEKGKIDGKIIYPLILRLREAYIIDCLLKNKGYAKKEFLQTLKKNKILELYDIYNSEKKGKKQNLLKKKKQK